MPAENQEAVLSAFEEEGWVQTIDDPLSPTAEVSPGVRLRDTVRRLNAGQTSQLLHFYGDGSGEHVLWEMLLPPVAARQILPRGLRTGRCKTVVFSNDKWHSQGGHPALP